MRKRILHSGWVLTAMWLFANSLALADTHLRFTGSINDISLDDAGLQKDIWLSPENARWNMVAISIIINYELDRVLVLSHGRKTYVETRWPFNLTEILPPSRRLDYSGAELDLDFEEGGREKECKEATQVTSVEGGRRQTLCLVNDLPGVDIEKVIDLQTTDLRVAAMAEGTARRLAQDGGMIVRMILDFKFNYQETRVLIELDFDAIREEDPPWNLYGIPVGYEQVSHLDPEELAGFRDGSFQQGSTGGAAPSSFSNDRNRLQIRSGHRGPVTAVHFVEDDRLALTGGADGSIRVWDVAMGREMLLISAHDAPVTALDATGGMMGYSGDSDGNLRVWSLHSGELMGAGRKYHRGITSLEAYPIMQERVLVSTDSRVAVAAATPRCDTAMVLRARQETGQWPRDCVEVEPNPRQTLKFVGRTRFTRIRGTRDGTHIATANRGGVTAVWDGDSGEEFWRHQGTSSINDLAFSASGQRLAAVNAEGSLQVWETTGQSLLQLTAHGGQATAVVFLAEDRVATAGRDGRVHVWKLPEGRTIISFELSGAPVLALAASDGGEYLLAGSEDGGARHLRVATGETVQTLRGFARPVKSLWFHGESPALAVSYEDIGTVLWDLREGVQVYAEMPDSQPSGGSQKPGEPGAEERRWVSEDSVSVRKVSADGRFILTGTSGGRLGIFAVADGEPLLQVEGLKSPITALALSPDHRILASATEVRVELWDVSAETRLVGLVRFIDGSWLVIDEEGRYDSDRPGNLPGVAWVLAGQPLETYPVEFFLRDYFTPGLLARRIVGVDLPTIQRLDSRNLLRPAIEIAEIEQRSAPREVDVIVDIEEQVVDPRMGIVSGVEDLRLFRDQRLVAAVPQAGGAVHLEPDPSSGRTRIRFEGIRLPAHKRFPEVTFEAYAFNSDRIKSSTASRSFTLPEELPFRPGKVYLINVGVSDYRDDQLDLTYAAADAHLFGSTLSEALRELGTYEEIVSVVLASEESSTSWAEKAHLREALARLGGRPPEIALPEGELQRTSPEDLVLISLAGHGVVDRSGVFYFLPSDFDGVRKGGLETWDLSGAVSSTELASWLQDVDASEIVLIVDACYSAATIDSQGFRPGPMGSRGLGELAYNKGMRVLAATQNDAVAIESESVRQGLLTYALLREGLGDGAADRNPVDGRLYVGEWLAYAVTRVPELYSQIVGNGRGAIILAETSPQKPRLFDFSHAGPGPVLKIISSEIPEGVTQSR